jgi:hypothetical protein
MMQEAERILSMEEVPDELQAKLQHLLQKLDVYYRSDDWKQDFADDEAGLLPKNLKRGVLSEDGLYNLLSSFSTDQTPSSQG